MSITPVHLTAVNLSEALASFDDKDSPRIVTRVNDYDVRIAHTRGEQRHTSRHRPGGSILMFEPTGTSTTGDRHEGDVPEHVDSTAGHALATPERGSASDAVDRCSFGGEVD
ncbi:hypothetical protein [Micromonospora sp. NPDC005171]|uniref:hypothetical protein n=1 Tax=Micromonospora sp. NPDC005171 TaxID=3156866 RepID=UPI0033B2B388